MKKYLLLLILSISILAFSCAGTASSSASIIEKSYNIEDVRVSNLTAIGNAKTISIKWDDLKEAETYLIERLENNKWVVLEETKSLRYDDKDVTADTQYSYRVKGSNGKKSSLYSNQANAQIYTPVTNLIAKKGKIKDTIYVSWEANINISKYLVHFTSESDEKVVSTKNPYYILTNNEEVLWTITVTTIYEDNNIAESESIKYFNKVEEKKVVESSKETIIERKKPKTKIETPLNINSSVNYVKENDKSNKEGFYGVVVSWSKVDNANNYVVYKSEHKKNEYKVIAMANDTSIVDKNFSTLGIKYDYRVRAIDSNGNLSKASSVTTGYPAITDQLYLKACYKLATHYWYFKKKSEIYKKVEEAGFNSLGSEKMAGEISGSVDYYARVHGFGGLITFTFKDYENVDWLKINGYYEIFSNISKDGYFTGEVTTTNMYPGHIKYNKLKLKDGIAKGYLSVTQHNSLNHTTSLPPINYEDNNS